MAIPANSSCSPGSRKKKKGYDLEPLKSYQKPQKHKEKFNVPETALQYNQRCKLQVVPIVTGHKFPPEGYKYNSTETTKQAKLMSISEVRQDFTKYKNVQVGMLTGKVSGVIVLDFDDESEYERFKDKFDLPYTLSVKSGSAKWGKHLFFRYPQIVDHIKKGKRPKHLGFNKVDVLADGAIAVLPPSLHKSGNHYQWLDGLDPLEMDLGHELDEVAELPKKVLDILIGDGKKPDDEKPKKPRDVSEIVEQLQGVEKGERDDTCTSLCGLLAEGGASRKLAYLILRYSWDYLNTPPLATTDQKEFGRPDYTISKCINSIYDKHEAAQKDKTKTPSLIHIADVVENLKKTEWLIDGYIEKGAFMQDFGDSGAHKTFVALDRGLSIASGKTYHGLSVKRGLVFLSPGRAGRALADVRWRG